MHDVEGISRRYQSLLSACTLINSTLDPDTLLDIITKQAMEVTNAEASSILMMEDNGRALSFKVALGSVAHMLHDEKLPVGEGIAGWVAQKGEPLLIPDAQKDPRFSRGIDQKTGFCTHTLLCVPLKTPEKVLGVLEVINKKDDSHFCSSDVEFLMAIANQAAVAIENAFLYNQLKREKNRIESIVNGMTDGVIVMNGESEISLINPAAIKMFDLPGNTGVDLKAASEKLHFILDEVSSLTSDALFDIVLMKPENLILSNNVTLFRTPEDRNDGAVMVLRNITQSKEREVQKSEFLTLLAYKTFGPLENLVREIDMLVHDTSGDTPLRDIYEIQKNMLTLRSFVQKLYYFSELEAGPLRIERGSYRICDLLDEAVTLSRDELAGLIIEADIPELESYVMVDGGKVIEAFMLLILFYHSAILKEGEVLMLTLLENDDHYHLKVLNALPATMSEPMGRICGSVSLVDDFCRVYGGGDGMALLEFAFVRHLLDAHACVMTIEKQDDREFLIMSLPKDKGECVAYGQQVEETS